MPLSQDHKLIIALIRKKKWEKIPPKSIEIGFQLWSLKFKASCYILNKQFSSVGRTCGSTDVQSLCPCGSSPGSSPLSLNPISCHTCAVLLNKVKKRPNTSWPCGHYKYVMVITLFKEEFEKWKWQLWERKTTDLLVFTNQDSKGQQLWP